MQERLRSDIHWRCALATVTVGRVMATGSPPSPQEWARIAATGKAPAEEGQVEDAAAVAERFREILERPFRIGGRAWPATASIGFTLLSGHDDVERVLSEADKAMYAEKRSTKARQAS